MVINAYAKINLGLDVTGKRTDGYHEVRMIMQTVEVHDVLEVERTEGPGIVITSDRDDLPSGGDNLIHKAAKLIMEERGVKGGIKVHLTKNIPVAAGLAGGSSDAAATLKAVNILYDLGLSDEELMKLGVCIGADVPYCIMGGTALCEGIGEKLTPLPASPECRVLLAKPDIGISTAYVYKNLRLDKVDHPDIDAIRCGIENGDIGEVARNLGNVLESVTAEENPVIGNIKEIMSKDALAVLMSGSGPTVFGLFADEAGINRAYSKLMASGLAPELFISRFFDPE